MPWQKGGNKQKGSAPDATRNAHYPQKVTIEMLDTVNPEGKNRQNIEVLPYINKYLKLYEISDPQEIAHFLSQTAHESHLLPTKEGTNYNIAQAQAVFRSKTQYPKLRDPEWIKKVCNKKVIKKGKELFYCKPVDFFSYVYFQNKSLGNLTPIEGYNYIGRGLLQLTGRSNYEAFERVYKKYHKENPHIDVLNNPDLLISNLDYAVETAFVYWTEIQPKLHEIAATANVDDVTVLINSDLLNCQDRLKRFNNVAPLLGVPLDHTSTCKRKPRKHKKRK